MGIMLYSKRHKMNMAFIYMSPVHLYGLTDSVTPLELANFMEASFSKNDPDEKSLVEQMIDGGERYSKQVAAGFTVRKEILELWGKTIQILTIREEDGR